MNSKIIFILLVILFIIGLIGFLYYRSAIFSNEDLELEIIGSDSVKMADEVEYTVIYRNNGKFVLRNPKIIFEIPEDSLTEDYKTRFEESLKDINPREQGSLKFKARILGKEGDLKTVKAQLSYVPHNLSVRYESKSEFITKIDEVFIDLKYDLPKMAERGKEVSYSISYLSNIDYPLENISIKVEALTSLSIESSRPSSLDNFEWKLSTLNKSQGGKIAIKGKISEDAPDVLNLSARLGIWRDGVFIVVKETNSNLPVIGIPTNTQQSDNFEG